MRKSTKGHCATTGGCCAWDAAPCGRTRLTVFFGLHGRIRDMSRARLTAAPRRVRKSTHRQKLPPVSAHAVPARHSVQRPSINDPHQLPKGDFGAVQNDLNIISKKRIRLHPSPGQTLNRRGPVNSPECLRTEQIRHPRPRNHPVPYPRWAIGCQIAFFFVQMSGRSDDVLWVSWSIQSVASERRIFQRRILDDPVSYFFVRQMRCCS